MSTKAVLCPWLTELFSEAAPRKVSSCRLSSQPFGGAVTQWLESGGAY
jgi:hypothetical protein